MNRLIVTFLACEALLLLRWYPGRGFLTVLVMLMAIKYLLLQYIPVFYGYGYLFLAAIFAIFLHLLSSTISRRSFLAGSVGLRGLANPWHTGTRIFRLFTFSPKVTLFVIEPLAVAAYVLFCYATPMTEPFWLPLPIPIAPEGFVYDYTFLQQATVFGRGMPLLLPLAVFVFNKLEWEQSFEAFDEKAATETVTPSRPGLFSRKAKAPPPEFTFPPISRRSTRAGPASPSVNAMARRFPS